MKPESEILREAVTAEQFPTPVFGFAAPARARRTERGWLVGVTDRARSSTEEQRYQFVHDQQGRIVGIHELGASPVARFACTYTSAGELHQVRDACNGLWTCEYDAAHRWTRQIDPRGYGYTFRYDDQGRCIHARGDDGLWEARVEYFPNDRYTKYVEGEDALWTYHYDHEGFITKIVNPDGGVRLRNRDVEGRILEDIDPGGRTLTFQYDSDGANTARVDRFGYVHPPESVTPGLVDPFRRELPSTALARTLAGCLEHSPDAMLGATGRLLEIPAELRRLAHGVFRMRGAGGSALAPELRTWSDPLGHPTYEIDGLQRARRRGYDPSGNEVAFLDRDGRYYRTETTSWNLVGARIDPLGNTVRYEYDSLEQMVGLTDPLGNVTRWGYDRSKRLTRVWRHERLRDVYEYDAGDHLVAKFDGDGELIFRNAEFHENHFVSRRELASGGEHRFDYDARGRIIQASTARHDVRLGYDFRDKRAMDLRDGEGLERWVSETREQLRLLGRFEWSCELLPDGSTRLTAPNGEVTHLRHGSDGVVLRECSNRTREWLQYDHEGRLEGRLTSRASPAGNAVGWGVRYGYSPEGDLLSVSDSARGTTQYQVDEAHRLIGETTPAGEQLRWEFDAAGNLIDGSARSRLSLLAGNRIDATATEVFEHDRRDRITIRRHRDGPVTRYRYDSFDMLEKIERVDGDHTWIWHAAYDAIGRRLWTESDNGRREFYWDGDRLAAEIDTNGRLRIYLYAGHDALAPLAFIDYDDRNANLATGRLYHVFCDGAGMPLHIEDGRGEIVWWASRIDPWGNIAVHESAQLEYNLRWPGHYFDQETGLHYNRYRYYDPELGRYLTPDPIGYRGSEVNLYAYCANPLVQVDVLGLAHSGKGDGPDTRSTSGDVDGVDAAPSVKPKVNAEVAGRHKTASKSQRQEEVMIAGVRNKETGQEYTANNRDGAALDRSDMHPIVRERVEAQDRINDTNKRLLDSGMTTDKINNMTPDQMRAELAADGIPESVQGMDTAAQLRNTNERVKFNQERNPSASYDDHLDTIRSENGKHGEIAALNDALNDTPDVTHEDLDNYELYNQRLPSNKSKPVVDRGMPRCGCCRGVTSGVDVHPDVADSETFVDSENQKLW